MRPFALPKPDEDAAVTYRGIRLTVEASALVSRESSSNAILNFTQMAMAHQLNLWREDKCTFPQIQEALHRQVTKQFGPAFVVRVLNDERLPITEDDIEMAFHLEIGLISLPATGVQ